MYQAIFKCITSKKGLNRFLSAVTGTISLLLYQCHCKIIQINKVMKSNTGNKKKKKRKKIIKSH